MIIRHYTNFEIQENFIDLYFWSKNRRGKNTMIYHLTAGRYFKLPNNRAGWNKRAGWQMLGN